MRALLIDDHPLVLADMQRVLSALGDRVSLVVAGSAGAARTVLEQEGRFDLVVLDLQARGAEGLAFLAEIRSLHPSLPVVALAGGGMRLGEAPIRLDPLRLLTDLSRQNAFPLPSFADAGEIEVDGVGWRFRTTAHASLGQLGLTRRQTQVLSYLLEGWSNKAIARELCLSVDTVKDHVTALMRALKVRSRTQAVLAVTLRIRQHRSAEGADPALLPDSHPHRVAAAVR